MRKVKCENCGAIFETDAPNVKYCSPVCKVEGGRAKRRQWEIRQPDYNHNYYQSHKEARKQSV